MLAFENQTRFDESSQSKGAGRKQTSRPGGLFLKKDDGFGK
jgi:hypothetical protein